MFCVSKNLKQQDLSILGNCRYGNYNNVVLRSKCESHVFIFRGMISNFWDVIFGTPEALIIQEETSPPPAWGGRVCVSVCACVRAFACSCVCVCVCVCVTVCV